MNRPASSGIHIQATPATNTIFSIRTFLVPLGTAPPNQGVHGRLFTRTTGIFNPISAQTCLSALSFLYSLPHPHPLSRPLPATQHPTIGPHTRVRRVAQAPPPPSPPDRDLVACNMTDAPAARPCTPGSVRFGCQPPRPRHKAVGPGGLRKDLEALLVCVDNVGCGWLGGWCRSISVLSGDGWVWWIDCSCWGSV
ncbi:hypothetical protein BKA80DRAFT_97258 [Phyllosticta citrichinensis]